jgi:hypothetical protein
VGAVNEGVFNFLELVIAESRRDAWLYDDRFKLIENQSQFRGTFSAQPEMRQVA